MLNTLGFFYLPDAQKKLAVWSKGRVIPGQDPSMWRYDDYGNFIQYSEYGNRNSPFGWEIDHRIPVANGGGDGLLNLRPLHWRKNASLGGQL